MEERKTILLIDDEIDFVKMLKGVLEDEGYRVETAHDGMEGLERLKTVRPHLIVLDMNMPRLGGIGFYHEITKGHQGLPPHPVLVLTARANLEQLFKDLSVDGFMTKPFEIDDLLTEIRIIMIKRFGQEERVAREDSFERPKKILVIENEAAVFDRIVIHFVNQGYVLTGAKTGVQGLERASGSQPDLILIKLGLPDLQGDMVAMKLRQMAKTSNIPLLLYTPHQAMIDPVIMNQICQKLGLRDLIMSDDPSVLYAETEMIFKNR